MHKEEKQIRERGFEFIAGVDEAGRGPLAGPVVAATVIFPESYRNKDIQDSKAISFYWCFQFPGRIHQSKQA